MKASLNRTGRPGPGARSIEKPSETTARMINVLVRYLVNDDPRQAAAARALLGELTPERPGFVGKRRLP